MTTPCTKNLRDLIGSLCDQQLQRGEIDQLNRLLDSDPFAQEECLDQLLINGLLQHEFAGSPQPVSLNQKTARSYRMSQWSRCRVSLAFVVVFVAGMLGLWSFRLGATAEAALRLSNLSFEDAANVSFEPTMLGWYGDNAHAVREASGVSPQHGSQMLRLVRSANEPGDTCEIYQIVDLRDVPRLQRGSPMFIEASAAVNSLPNDAIESYVFAIHLYASPVNPIEQQTLWPATWKSNVSFVGNQLIADSNHHSWQQIRSLLPLQAEAKFLLIKISVRSDGNRNGDEFPGQFVDNVQVRLKDAKTL